MAVRALVWMAAAMLLSGCAWLGRGGAPGPVIHVTRIADAPPTRPICSPAQRRQALVRDLTVPYASRVYITPTGPCVPPPGPAVTSLDTPTSLVVAPARHGAEFDTPYASPHDIREAVEPTPRALTAGTFERAFADELAAGRLAIVDDEGGAPLRLVLRGDTVFRSGSARLRPPALRLVKRLGWAAMQAGVALSVTGHTDSVPVHHARFGSNQILSQARADAAASALRALSRPPLDVTALGRGADEPVADNATVRGRAQNRRIEIRIARRRAPL